MSARNTVVVAGAGTGKTHALVEHYLLCLLGLDGDGAGACDEQGGPGIRTPDRVLAITFTDKAAAEMRARVQRRLATVICAPHEEPGILARARAAGRSLESPAERRALEELRRAVTTAPILTFHAFCGRTLRDHALALGLDPAFELLEPEEERRLLHETAEACVLDLLQRGSAPCAELVARVALRGFGERKGLVECLVDLHGLLAERGLHPATLPLATDARVPVTTAIAGLEARVEALAALARGGAGQGARRSLEIEEALRAVVAAWAGAHDAEEDSDREAAVARAFAGLAARVGGNWGGKSLAEARQAVVAACDALGASLVDAFTAELAPVVRDLLVDLDVRQQREKDARGFLAFGDLLVRTRDLLRDVPSVRAAVKGRFERVLVDEYQDTSPVQEDVLALLLEEPTRGAPHSEGTSAAGALWARVALEPGRGFVVGDPKQSIYGFRGADAGVFSRALDVIGTEPLGARAELTVSRRSRAPVVALANLVAEHALPRGPFGVERAQVVPLTAARGGEGAAGEVWPVVADDSGPQGRRPRSELEADVVAAGVARLVRAGEARPRDVAVLVRRTRVASAMSLALARAGLPAVVVGGDGFYARPEVTDVVGALGLAVDPEDEVGVLAMLRSPFVAAPDDQILALYECLPRARGLSWSRARAAADDPRIDEGMGARIRAFDGVLTHVRHALLELRGPGSPVARAIDVLLDEGGYLVACAVEPDAALRVENIEKLRAIVERRRESAFVTVARLVEAIEDNPPEPLAVPAADDTETDGHDDAVRIMTIHQSKGLEFPVVVVADGAATLRLEADDLAYEPGIGLAVTERGRPIAACVPRGRAGDAGALTAMQRVRRSGRARGEAELARLLYVALTRARDRVIVVAGPHRAGPSSMLGILDAVRAEAPEVFDALLPVSPVTLATDVARMATLASIASPTGGRAPTPEAAPHRDEADTTDAAVGSSMVSSSSSPGPLRVRASDLEMQPIRDGSDRVGGTDADGTDAHGPDADGPDANGSALSPLDAGRVAHAAIALVATEAPDVLENAAGTVERLVRRVGATLGVAPMPAPLVERCVATLRGPVRALVRDGFVLSFEEPLRMVREGVVVEGRADLVARSATQTVVVELQLGAAAPGAGLQVAAYGAALADAGDDDVLVATWVLGDGAPPQPVRLGDASLGALDAALARLGTARAPAARAAPP